MQTSIFLPLILIAGTGSNAPAYETADARASETAHEVFAGCRAPVLDTREASKILFQARVDRLDEVFRAGLSDAADAPLYVAHCGEEFVLFNGRDGDDAGDVLYLRYEDKTYELVDERWG